MKRRANIRNRAFEWMGEGYKPMIDRDHFMGHSSFDFPSQGEVADSFKKLVLDVSVPGFPKEGLEVLLRGDELTVRGCKPLPATITAADYVHEEQATDCFERKFRLAAGLPTKRVEAQLEGEVLHIAFFSEGNKQLKRARMLEVA